MIPAMCVCFFFFFQPYIFKNFASGLEKTKQLLLHFSVRLPLLSVHLSRQTRKYARGMEVRRRGMM